MTTFSQKSVSSTDRFVFNLFWFVSSYSSALACWTCPHSPAFALKHSKPKFTELDFDFYTIFIVFTCSTIYSDSCQLVFSLPTSAWLGSLHLWWLLVYNPMVYNSTLPFHSHSLSFHSHFPFYSLPLFSPVSDGPTTACVVRPQWCPQRPKRGPLRDCWNGY